jgi:hypothetical protein
MNTMSAFRLSRLFGLLLIARASAQVDCTGDTYTYNQSGLVVPFRNLCGKDISAPVDFNDPTNELTRAACFDRCVRKAPLCYGFDYATPGYAQYSCWLMQGYFLESSAIPTDNVNAAMLSPDFLAGLSDDCRSLGLNGCFQKNGQLGTVTSQKSSTTTQFISTTSSSASSSGAVATTSTSVTPSSTNTARPTVSSSPSKGLSTGAKAGIGAGVGIAGLLAILAVVLVLLKRRKRSAHYGTGPPQSHPVEKTTVYSHRAELPAPQSHHTRAELESPAGAISAAQPKAYTGATDAASYPVNNTHQYQENGHQESHRFY